MGWEIKGRYGGLGFGVWGLGWVGLVWFGLLSDESYLWMIEGLSKGSNFYYFRCISSVGLYREFFIVDGVKNIGFEF